MARPLKTAKARGANAPDQISTTIRMGAELRRRLEEAAAGNDRNLSQEMERRLRRSFDIYNLGEDLAAAAAADGGINSFNARMAVGMALHSICGREPSLNASFVAFKQAMIALLNETAPGTKVKVAKVQLERLKTAVREIEKNSIIVNEEE